MELNDLSVTSNDLCSETRLEYFEQDGFYTNKATNILCGRSNKFKAVGRGQVFFKFIGKLKSSSFVVRWKQIEPGLIFIFFR